MRGNTYHYRDPDRSDDCECDEAEPEPCYWPWLCCCLLLLLLGLLLIVFLLPSPDRLVLADNTTQLMVDGNWTDVFYDRNLITSPRWAHGEQPVGPNAEITSLVAGTYQLYIAIHPEIETSLFSLSDPPPAPCGTCPCAFASCSNSNNSLCCDPAAGWTLGNMSVCGNDVCFECLAQNASCVDNNQCRCGGRFNMSCLSNGTGSFCAVDFPDAPCGFCPCAGETCSNNTDCCDPLQFGFGNASYCNGFLGNCQPCVASSGVCTFDSDCNCFDPQYHCLSAVCTFVPSLAPTRAPTAPIPCTNVTQCPYNSWCDISGGDCGTCSNELVTCCNTTSQCTLGQYCSPTLGICMPCVAEGGDCTGDPLNACNCTPSDSLGCISGICTVCTTGAIGDACASDLDCSCTNATLCLPDPSQDNNTFCQIPCSSQNDCPNDSFYCSPDLHFCVPCAGYAGDCTQDPLYQCNCSGFNNLTSPLICDIGGTNLCLLACDNETQCPYGSYCSPYDPYCHPCLPESQCCNTTADCFPYQYCSPTFGVCINCSNFSQDCSLDPTSECNCTPSDNLFCNTGTFLCDVATAAPTAAPTPAPLCPPVPTIYARLVRQRGPNPAFLPVGAPFVPVISGSMYLVTTLITTQVGDVLKVQWMSPDCPIMALTPIPFDLGLIGVPGQGVKDTSAYFVANNN